MSERSHLTTDHPFSDLPFLIVGGVGRSGTTVLRNCIAAHPQIETLNRESNYIFDLMRNAHVTIDKEFRVKNMVVSISDFWHLHQQLILDLHWPRKTLLPKNQPLAISTYSMLDPRAAIAMSQAFPRLSICYIVRNGIEVVSSYNSFKNFQHLEFEDCCRIWAFRFDMIQYVTQNPHCTLLRYEWLNDDRSRFQAGLTEAFNQSGIDFAPHCLKPLDTRFHPTRFQGETRADAKNMAKRRDRWQLWTDAQRDQFESICGNKMRELDYEIPWVAN